jgi:hypothetical protein
VDVSEASKYLLHQLDCDDWYVAAQREHLLVVHLSKASVHKYAVCFECTTPVEKAVYHGSKAWSLSILPLGNTGPLPGEKAGMIRAGLGNLSSGAT